MKKPAHPGAIAVAIFNFVLSLGCICVAGGNGLQVIQSLQARDPVLVEQQSIMKAEVPLWPVYQAVNVLLPMLVTLWLIVNGIGLIMMQGWARISSIVLAAFILLRRGSDLIFYFLFVVPAINTYFDHVVRPQMLGPPPAGQDAQAYESGARIGFFMGSGGATALGADCFGIVYAAIVLGIMFMPGVRNAFLKKRRRPRYEDEYDDNKYRRRDVRRYDDY